MSDDKATGEPIIIETFQLPSKYSYADMRNAVPRVINGVVSYRKYRVAIELIDEPVDVLKKRLQELYDKSHEVRSWNSHHWQPLLNAAKSIGVELEKT